MYYSEVCLNSITIVPKLGFCIFGISNSRIPIVQSLFSLSGWYCTLYVSVQIEPYTLSPDPNEPCQKPGQKCDQTSGQKPGPKSMNNSPNRLFIESRVQLQKTNKRKGKVEKGDKGKRKTASRKQQNSFETMKNENG